MSATLQTDAITTVVSYRASASDPWTTDDTIMVDSVSFRVAPEFGRAVLSRRYGFLHETSSDPDSTFRGTRTALNLAGKLVRIVLTQGTDTHTWYGVVVNQPGSIRGSHANPDAPATTVDSGVTTYDCVSTAYFLAKRQITQAWVAGPTVAELAPVAPTFNTGVDGELRGNRSLSVDFSTSEYFFQGVYRFNGTGGSSTWTALQVLTYLLQLFEAETGLAYTLSAASQHAELANIERVWSQERRTFWQLLNELVNPAQGFALLVDGFELTVVSTVAEAIELDATTILPANANTVTLAATTFGGSEPPRIVEVEDSHYDKVLVRGDRLKVLLTMQYDVLYPAKSTLQPDWTSGNETALPDGGDGNLNEATDTVYCQFVIPDDWDGTTYAGGVQIPQVNPAITATSGADIVDESSAQARWPQGLRLLRGWPRVPYALGTAGNISITELVPAQAWAEDDQGVWRRVDAPNSEYPPAAGIALLADRPGIRIRAPYPWMFGRGQTAAETLAGGQGLPTVYDWTDLLVTVFVATNEHERVEVAVDDPPNGLVEKVKVIDIPEAQLWWAPDDTVLNVEADGTQRTIADTAYSSNGGVLLSHRDSLRKIATLAKAWYGQRRSQVRVNYREPVIRDLLGHVIVETDTGAAVEPTGTIITRIDYTLGSRQRVALQSEWFDLDWRRVFGARAGIPIADTGGMHASGGAVTPTRGALGIGAVNPPGLFYTTAASSGYGFAAHRIKSDGDTNGPATTIAMPTANGIMAPAKSMPINLTGYMPAMQVDGVWTAMNALGCMLRYLPSTRTLYVDYQTADGTARQQTLVIAADTDSDIILGGDYATSYSGLTLALSASGLDWHWTLGHITLDGSAISEFVAHCHKPWISRQGKTENVTISGTTLKFQDGLYYEKTP